MDPKDAQGIRVAVQPKVVTAGAQQRMCHRGSGREDTGKAGCGSRERGTGSTGDRDSANTGWEWEGRTRGVQQSGQVRKSPGWTDGCN